MTPELTLFSVPPPRPPDAHSRVATPPAEYDPPPPATRRTGRWCCPRCLCAVERGKICGRCGKREKDVDK